MTTEKYSQLKPLPKKDSLCMRLLDKDDNRDLIKENGIMGRLGDLSLP